MDLGELRSPDRHHHDAGEQQGGVARPEAEHEKDPASDLDERDQEGLRVRGRDAEGREVLRDVGDRVELAHPDVTKTIPSVRRTAKGPSHASLCNRASERAEATDRGANMRRPRGSAAGRPLASSPSSEPSVTAQVSRRDRRAPCNETPPEET